jgi:hypothetical protein
VSVTGGLPTVDEDKRLARLADTDVWYRTEKIPNDARFTYHFVIKSFAERRRSHEEWRRLPIEIL